MFAGDGFFLAQPTLYHGSSQPIRSHTRPPSTTISGIVSHGMGVEGAASRGLLTLQARWLSLLVPFGKLLAESNNTHY